MYPYKFVKLGDGRAYSWANYCKAWRAAKPAPAGATFTRGFEWYPETREEALRKFRAGVHDRINLRSGSPSYNDDTIARQRRFFRRAQARASVTCRNCGGPAVYNNHSHRFCSDSCRQDYI